MKTFNELNIGDTIYALQFLNQYEYEVIDLKINNIEQLNENEIKEWEEDLMKIYINYQTEPIFVHKKSSDDRAFILLPNESHEQIVQLYIDKKDIISYMVKSYENCILNLTQHIEKLKNRLSKYKDLYEEWKNKSY